MSGEWTNHKRQSPLTYSPTHGFFNDPTNSLQLQRYLSMKRTLARRRGNIVAMTAVLMIVLIAFVALAVDVGYLYTVRNELQRSADAAAIAATWELINKDGNTSTQTADSL